MDAIASSPLAEGLLRGVDRYGVVGLALVPRALMHPAALRPLRGPGDYAGTQFLVARSRTTGDLLAAYGAKAVFTVKAVTSKGPPGAIFPLTDDGTDVQTGNVTLYPRFGTLFANSGVFDRLSHDQRAALLAAAKDMVDEAITQTPSEEAAARVHCQTGRVVLASPSELGALRRAAQPVLAKLERDLQTRAAIAAIRSLAARTPPDPPLVVPQRCRA
jgi:TRAP-type C4-dicarboxylate transport system substrate-binding protein